MAAFCKECSIEMFGKDYGDLAHAGARALTEEELKRGEGWVVLCEGCGFITVNDEGERINYLGEQECMP